jgi:futalosine hydrolase
MNLLIVAATEFEIKPLQDQNLEADYLITGVGIPATIFHLTKKLMAKNYNLAFQVGIGGTFNDAMPPGDVVLIKEDAFGDLGIEENGKLKTLFETGFAGKDDFPYEDGLLINRSMLLEKIDLPKARAITVNKVMDGQIQIDNNKERFNADIESMEGAAFHYVCLQQKINFLQIRGVSNIVGERDKAKWRMKTAIENMNNEVLKIIKNLYIL